MNHPHGIQTKILAILMFSFLITSSTFALEHLQGNEAKEYLGNFKDKFVKGKYTYEVLARSHRDSMNGRFSDGVIFSNITDRFYYKKRTDGNHVIIIGREDGRLENPVTAEPLIWNPLANTLSDDHPKPHVFLENGKELAVVFIGRKTQLKSKMTDEGLLEIALKVKGRKIRMSRKSR